MKLGLSQVLVAMIAASLFGVVPQSPGQAQTAASFPSKPIRIVVPFAPGGSSDILARGIGQKLSELWSQSVVIENKPGADGILGADAVAKSAPDGHTLLLVDISTLTISKLLYAKVPFDPAKDFAPVSMLAFSPHALAVHPSVPANTVPELIAWSKANPGKLNFGSSSGAVRLAEAQLKASTGLDMLVVPYKGGAAALTALTGGEINILLNGLLATQPHIKGGRIKGIAVASAKRMVSAPDLPTMIEGGVAGFVTGSFQGILAPGGTPADIVEKLQSTIAKILAEPEMNARLTGQGAEIVASKPAEFSTLLASEQVRWTKVATEAGIKPE
jgi:tripartite-type tricarboxylate transporter receptor subunit TctC